MKNHELVLGTLTTSDINFAQLQWIKFDQNFMIDSEHFTNIQSSLNLFYDDDNTLRVKTRICGFENFTYNKKFRTSLKNDSYFTKLIVLKSHEDVYHSGVDSTLNFITRLDFWIIRGRQTVKKLLKVVLFGNLFMVKLWYLLKLQHYQHFEYIVAIVLKK